MDFENPPIEIRSFIAASMIDAATKIRTELGPDAVVLDIRQVKPEGLARLWRKPKIEVLACKPRNEQNKKNKLEILQAEVERLKSILEQNTLPSKSNFDSSSEYQPVSHKEDKYNDSNNCSKLESVTPDLINPDFLNDSVIKESYSYKDNYSDFRDNNQKGSIEINHSVYNPIIALDHLEKSDWRINLLDKVGIEACYMPLILEQWQANDDQISGQSIRSLINIFQKIWGDDVINDFLPGLHFFIGPPGSGKSVTIGKIVSRLVLNDSASVSIVRLDGSCANTSELPLIYSEILGVPCIRKIPDVFDQNSFVLVDMPGINWQHSEDLGFISKLLEKYKNAHFHLVLNICYETRLLLNQIRAFRKAGNFDLVFTHIDEETRPGKLINFKLGTNCTVSFISGGQNIPGFFEKGEFDKVVNRIFPEKRI